MSRADDAERGGAANGNSRCPWEYIVVPPLGKGSSKTKHVCSAIPLRGTFPKENEDTRPQTVCTGGSGATLSVTMPKVTGAQTA